MKRTPLNRFNEISRMKTKDILKIKLQDIIELGAMAPPEFWTSAAVFKTGYRPMDRGNSKVHSSVLCFSLLPVITCRRMCKGCYDIKSLRHTDVKRKRLLNTILATCYPEFLEAKINLQVKRSRTVKTIRIHVGGDMFSQEYADMWGRIAMENKDKVNTYTYTKSSFLIHPEINVVTSSLPDGRLNYGNTRYMRMAQLDYPEINFAICPATVRNVPDGYCGHKCKACHVQEHILFHIH